LTATGEEQPDDSFLVMMNANHEDREWTIPALDVGTRWQVLIDTSTDDGFSDTDYCADGDTYVVESRSLVLMLRSHSGTDERA
jgi:glycogen operon protein